ncbi:MAG: ATP-binding region, ATPase-like:Histidine kinase, region:Histidine kinase N-terminal [Proteobacteria bacterium]|nr:ATP-binding region, ATPase-like:Histidine kinase, region:Histidine kinase N-terminal [Pseudomonadota bacterium]
MPMPRTLLARTFVLLAMLVLLTTAAWLSLFRYIDAEPRARETAQLAASAVNLIRASLFAAAPEKRLGLFTEFSTREGIRLLPAEPEDEIEAMPDSRFFRLLQRELTVRLGEHTRIAASVDGVSGFWVSFRLDDADDEEYWLVLPRERAARSIAGHWLAWGLLAIVLAMAVAWLIASRISRPLKAMAKSAETVGRGQIPNPLPEDGAEELSRLATAFNTMAADLQRHEKDRSEVLAGISHDLRTPLTRLRLEAEMSVADDGARQAVVTDIEQMEAVISQFMDYARAESGEAPSLTDLPALLAGLAERQTYIGRQILTEIQPLPEVLVRPKAITRAINNLVDNAAKYGGGEITLKAVVANDEIQIEVADRGPGVPPDDVERLKRPFTRLEAARTNATGTGLGLAIVERIARLHEGRFDLLPNPGGGLLARLSLPIRR